MIVYHKFQSLIGNVQHVTKYLRKTILESSNPL